MKSDDITVFEKIHALILEKEALLPVFAGPDPKLEEELIKLKHILDSKDIQKAQEVLKSR